MAAPTAGLGFDMRQRRKELGLTQHDLASLSGVSAHWIHNLENGKATVRLDKLVAVLAVLGLELRADLRQPGVHRG